MKQGVPTITAPISRTKRSNSPPEGLICAILLAAFVLAVALIFVVVATSSAADGDSEHSTTTQPHPLERGKEGALRSSTVLRDKSSDVLPPKPAETTGDASEAQGLILHTSLGDIRIHFTPELAGTSSIHYVEQVVKHAAARNSAKNPANAADGRGTVEGAACRKCKFYRAEPRLLLQGVLSDAAPAPYVVRGPCPVEDFRPAAKCPGHDPLCGCHGPVMTRGMVGWAGGGAGPDFFVNTFAKPVDWWERQHTVWGMVRDEASLAVVESAYGLPAHGKGMRMLDRELTFSLELF